MRSFAATERKLYRIGVPEVWGSTYDIRTRHNSAVQIRNGKPIADLPLGLAKKIALKQALKKAEGTDLEKLLKDHGFIG